jgi:hypothetical protein
MIRAIGLRLPLSILFLLTVACSSDEGSDPSPGSGGMTGGGGNGSGGAPPGGLSCSSLPKDASGNALLKANAANNYSFSSTITIQVTPVAANSELTFDWSAVTKDFQGHTVDPKADIDMVNLLMWSLPQAELETKLNDDELAQRDLLVPGMVKTQKSKTSVGLFDFQSIAGQPLEREMLLAYLNPEVYPPAEHSYTMVIASGEVAGRGSRMLKSFRLDPAVTSTQVVMDNSSTNLTYDANLTSLRPTAVPAGSANVSVEWSEIAVNAMGREFVPNRIEEVMVAKYSLTPAELEARFLDLETIADQMYRGEVASGTSLDLSTLKTDAGQSFTGIDASGTWIVALVCGNCMNPAPWYISILTPCSN